MILKHYDYLIMIVLSEEKNLCDVSFMLTYDYELIILYRILKRINLISDISYLKEIPD